MLLDAMSDVVRTPEEAFDDLPGFPFGARYTELGGLRIARVDEGDGGAVLFMHGEPTWSFLWRKVMGPVLEAGFRCIAPDLAGFGRSDKPTDIGWYSYDRHVELMTELVDQLALERATMVVHDWGGPIGLRVAVERPERFKRIVILDTGLFTGAQRMSDAWIAFRDFVERTEDLPVGFLVRGGCKHDPGEEVVAAYEAPFPTAASKAGARAFPLLIPTEPGAEGAQAGRRVLESLAADTRRALILWADSDPILPLATGERFAEAISRKLDHVIPDASHFLQEDQGELIGRHIASWLSA
jgi:haloalkane dehalogenase